MISDKLPVMMHSQSEFVLLRSCVFSTKIMFTFHTNMLTQQKNIWRYDSFIMECLSIIVSSSLSDVKWDQTSPAVSLLYQATYWSSCARQSSSPSVVFHPTSEQVLIEPYTLKKMSHFCLHNNPASRHSFVVFCTVCSSPRCSSLSKLLQRSQFLIGFLR